jgi:sucrose synthase
MLDFIRSIVQSEERVDLDQFLYWLRYQQEKRYLLRNDILSEFADFCAIQKKQMLFINPLA